MTEEQTFDKQPDESSDLKLVVKEFMDRMQNLDNEIELLNEDKKALKEEFAEKLDVKTLNEALKVLKIKKGVKHKDTFDTFVEILEDPST
jgi:uncharacterized protein (UPF0335 family)